MFRRICTDEHEEKVLFFKKTNYHLYDTNTSSNNANTPAVKQVSLSPLVTNHFHLYFSIRDSFSISAVHTVIEILQLVCFVKETVLLI